MLEKIKGYRTYAITAASLLAVFIAWSGGEMNGVQAITAALTALGLITARAPGAGAAKALDAGK